MSVQRLSRVRDAWRQATSSRPRRVWVRDAVVVLALAAVEFLGIRAIGGPMSAISTTPAAIALIVGSAALLLLCHPFPRAVVGVLAAVAFFEGAMGLVQLSAPALLVAGGIAAARFGWRAGLVAFAVIAAVLAVGSSWSPGALITRVALVAAAVSIGLYVSASANWRREARLRRERESEQQLAEAENLVAVERARIARELHDVVAHYLTLIVIQAGAAQTVMESGHPSRSHIDAVESASRRALEEMRRMVGVLRLSGTPSPSERTPQPSLVDLETLVANTRSAGRSVALVTFGDLGDLPAGIDLSAYRIIQEALTNVVRHSTATQTNVTVDRQPETLTITVEDNGAPMEATPHPAGVGLIGMRERVNLLGGRLIAGNETLGGWTVRAEIPLHVS